MSLSCPQTSILTCTYNMGSFLPRVAQSVFRQNCSDYEWLLLDDGSSDAETSQFLTKIQGHPKVRVFRFPIRQGLTEARNFLLAESQGQFISILDADDWLARTKIFDHSALLASSPDVGVVWGRSLMLLGEGAWSLIPKTVVSDSWDLISDYSASHSATTWRKSYLLRVGGYDPEKLLVEGPDMFLKIGDFAKQVFCPHVACVKRVNAFNLFRTQLREMGASYWNRRLFTETVARRFGPAQKPV